MPVPLIQFSIMVSFIIATIEQKMSRRALARAGRQRNSNVSKCITLSSIAFTLYLLLQSRLLSRNFCNVRLQSSKNTFASWRNPHLLEILTRYGRRRVFELFLVEKEHSRTLFYCT
jgi:hypothetical protein